MFHKKFRVLASLLIIQLLAAMLSGCAGREELPKKGDFSFNLPSGYSLMDIQDVCCTIVRDADGVDIGSVELTRLGKRNLSSKGISKIMKYLRENFHKTNNVEYIAFVGEDGGPFVVVDLTRTEDETGEKRQFYHIFFEKGQGVYHLWLNKDVIEQEPRNQLISIITE